MNPLVSIIIPVYNSERYIGKTLQSILRQTYDNKEIIIVDDESTDNSYAIAKSYETINCKVIHQKNGGAAIARNTGLAHASGDYIQFLDVDDFLSVDKIEKQVLALEGKKNKVAVCDYVCFMDDTELKEKIVTGNQSAFIYSTDNPAEFLINLWGGSGASNFIQTNSWLVPRQIIDKAGKWRNYRCPDDDGEFFSRVLLASEGVVYVPGIHNFYRSLKGEHKLSANRNKKYVQNTLLSIDLKYKYLQEFTTDKAMNKAFAVQYLNFAVYNYPDYKILSKIAYRRYIALNAKAAIPPLGGNFLQYIGKMFGWKAARLIRYYLREKR